MTHPQPPPTLRLTSYLVPASALDSNVATYGDMIYADADADSGSSFNSIQTHKPIFISHSFSIRMTRAPLPRYASLVDTASGDFSHTFKSRNPPVPLSIDEAPSLDAYVQSFKVEVHRDSWRPAQDAGAEGFEDPTVTHCGNANVIHNESLNQANIRVHARLYEEKLIAFGECFPSIFISMC